MRPAAGLMRELNMRNALKLIILSAAFMATTACNTVRGVGEDVESAADAVDRAT